MTRQQRDVSPFPDCPNDRHGLLIVMDPTLSFLQPDIPPRVFLTRLFRQHRLPPARRYGPRQAGSSKPTRVSETVWIDCQVDSLQFDDAHTPEMDAVLVRWAERIQASLPRMELPEYSVSGHPLVRLLIELAHDLAKETRKQRQMADEKLYGESALSHVIMSSTLEHIRTLIQATPGLRAGIRVYPVATGTGNAGKPDLAVMLDMNPLDGAQEPQSLVTIEIKPRSSAKEPALRTLVDNVELGLFVAVRGRIGYRPAVHEAAQPLGPGENNAYELLEQLCAEVISRQAPHGNLITDEFILPIANQARRVSVGVLRRMSSESTRYTPSDSPLALLFAQTLSALESLDCWDPSLPGSTAPDSDGDGEGSSGPRDDGDDDDDTPDDDGDDDDDTPDDDDDVDSGDDGGDGGDDPGAGAGAGGSCSRGTDAKRRKRKAYSPDAEPSNSGHVPDPDRQAKDGVVEHQAWGPPTPDTDIAAEHDGNLTKGAVAVREQLLTPSPQAPINLPTPDPSPETINKIRSLPMDIMGDICLTLVSPPHGDEPSSSRVPRPGEDPFFGPFHPASSRPGSAVPVLGRKSSSAITHRDGKDGGGSVQILGYRSHGAVGAVFSARMITPIRGVPRNPSLVVKLTDIDSAPLAADPDRPGHTQSSLRQALVTEARALALLAGSGLIPEYYGLFGSVQDGVGSERSHEWWCSLQANGGRSVPARQRGDPELQLAVRLAYYRLHEIGVVHGDVKWEHVLLAHHSTRQSPKTGTTSHPPVRVLLIDFDRAVLRQDVQQRTWDRYLQTERENVDNMLEDA